MNDISDERHEICTQKSIGTMHPYISKQFQCCLGMALALIWRVIKQSRTNQNRTLPRLHLHHLSRQLRYLHCHPRILSSMQSTSPPLPSTAENPHALLPCALLRGPQVQVQRMFFKPVRTVNAKY